MTVFTSDLLDKTKCNLQLVEAIKCAGPVSFDKAPNALFANKKIDSSGDLLSKSIQFGTFFFIISTLSLSDSVPIKTGSMFLAIKYLQIIK